MARKLEDFRHLEKNYERLISFFFIFSRVHHECDHRLKVTFQQRVRIKKCIYEKHVLKTVHVPKAFEYFAFSSLKWASLGSTITGNKKACTSAE